MKNLDKNRVQFRQQYHSELVTTVFIFISWACLQIEPRYTNQIVYFTAENVTDAAFAQFKILTYIKNLLLLIAWFVSSSSNGVQLGDIELEPDADDEEGGDDGSDGSDNDETNVNDE